MMTDRSRWAQATWFALGSIGVAFGVLACHTLLETPAVTAQSGRWGEPFVYELADEVRSEECSRLGCDLTPAFKRVFAACEAELEGTSQGRSATGCLFLIPAGDHTISETIAACRAHTFRGRGGNARRSLTKISAKVTAFHGRGFGDCQQGGSDGRLTIEDLGLEFPDGPHTTPVVGVLAEARLSISNVWITHADVGLWIKANTKVAPASNANASRVSNLSVQRSRHAGIILSGVDSNASAVWAPNINGACIAGDSTPEGQALNQLFGPCGGYVDRSFLGNFAESGHFAVAEGYPDILITGPSNHGTCFGCYVEGKTPPALEAAWSQWIGGIGARPVGPGFRLDGSSTTSIRVMNDRDPENIVWMNLGRSAGPAGSYYALRPPSSPRVLRMQWSPNATGGAFAERIDGVPHSRIEHPVHDTARPDDNANTENGARPGGSSIPSLAAPTVPGTRPTSE